MARIIGAIFSPPPSLFLIFTRHSRRRWSLLPDIPIVRLHVTSGYKINVIRHNGTIFRDSRALRREGGGITRARDSRVSRSAERFTNLPRNLFDVLSLLLPCQLQRLSSCLLPLVRGRLRIINRQRHAVALFRKSAGKFRQNLRVAPPSPSPPRTRKLPRNGACAFASARNHERASELANGIPCSV